VLPAEDRSVDGVAFAPSILGCTPQYDTQIEKRSMHSR
jgi:hypothetical protein